MSGTAPKGRPVTIGSGPRRAVVGGDALAVLAGPCVVESEALVLEVARRLVEWCDARGLPFVFKSSYKKANRSSVRSFTGPGDREGLAALARVKRELGVPILTDVHAVDEVGPAAEVADVLQVPAFLSRQTELLVACAQSGRPVKVKKGQFLAPEDMKQVVEKLESAGAAGVLVTERGATFGYHNLVVDMRSLVILGEFGWPVVYDVTHSLQMPGGETTGGDRRFALPLARAAVAVGVDGLFFETHPDPARALSDAATQLPLERIPALLDQVISVRHALEGVPAGGLAPARGATGSGAPTIAPASMPGAAPGGVSA
ncbi:MAG: 3-deoxy-8-phosphooctulonate synthase [Candidatus Eiseniibacteriota bacterium]